MELSEFLEILVNTLAIVAGIWICLVVFVCMTMKRGEKVTDLNLVLAGVGAAYLIALLIHHMT